VLRQASLPDILNEYIQGSDHPDLRIYRAGEGRSEDNSEAIGVTDPEYMKVWLWRTKHFCDLGEFYNGTILEVGCGFGWDAVGLAVTGNNKVIACDILPSMVEGMTECLETMKAKGAALPIEPLCGDICSLDLPSNTLDGIFSTEAVEHVHDLDRMFATCYRLLRPGRRLVIVNDSNRYNAGARANSWGMWTERDESWEHADWLRTQVRPVEHAQAKPYGAMREEKIREIAPDLGDESVKQLRRATAGMIYPEVERAVEQFKLDGSLPIRDEYSWCRNPETGEYAERLLDPFEIKAMLKRAGFKVKLRHMFRKMPLRLLNGIAFRPINERLFGLRPPFVLVAEKPIKAR